MGDPRRSRLRRRAAGDLEALQRILWQGLVRAERIVLDPMSDEAAVLKACHALATMAGAYGRIHEAAELVPRLEAIEAEQRGRS
jgi:hypothetical protein